MLQPRQFKGLRKPEGYPREIVTLGDQLKAKRLEIGLRQKDVAELLSVSDATLLGWEKNKHDPNVSMLPAIFRFLGHVPHEENYTPTIGSALLKSRRSCGLSQKRCAAIIGLDSATLSLYERDLKAPHRRFEKAIQRFIANSELHRGPDEFHDGPANPA